MRLVSYGPQGWERPGVLLENGILDLRAADAAIGTSVREILAHDRLDAVRRLAEVKRPEPLVPLRGTRLGPPIPDPSKIICIGRNYADHAAEQGKPLPEIPLLFAKAPSALIGTGDTILMPAFESRVDIEVELAVVIGRPARRIAAEEAFEYVAGYMCFNDVSGRLAQYDDKQWFRGKSFDTFGPCGPFMATRDSIPDPHALDIGSRVDDRVMQSSNTRQMVHRIPELIEYITRSLTLVPGDIISTGTPAGVGVFRDPPVFLKDNETVTVWIENLGEVTNPVRAERPPR